MDHVGCHTRCVEDANIVWRNMRDDNPAPFARAPISAGTSKSEAIAGAPRLGYIRKVCEHKASFEVAEHLAEVMNTFGREGAVVVDMELPESSVDVEDAWRTIVETEVAWYHYDLFKSKREQYPPKLRARIERGQIISGHKYVQALSVRNRFQVAMLERLRGVDAVCMPAAQSTAFRGITGGTGSNAFNLVWSFTGFPSISIPSGVGRQGLPLAVQLAALPMGEENLLEVASWCEGVLAFDRSPETVLSS